ncbi:MAG TPA: tetratricopeptide repeat protein, partial [Steroidobacteraceae bacterium]|nr:tetratricopeptide repeat protein [Steroidobacteraceae bacterium]
MLASSKWSKLGSVALIAALLASACTVPVTQPGREPTDRKLVTQAEKLSRDGDHRGAAQTFEQAAAQAPGELRDRFLLRAAREYVRGDQVDEASALLKQVGTTLPSA